MRSSNPTPQEIYIARNEMVNDPELQLLLLEKIELMKFHTPKVKLSGNVVIDHEKQIYSADKIEMINSPEIEKIDRKMEQRSKELLKQYNIRLGLV